MELFLKYETKMMRCHTYNVYLYAKLWNDTMKRGNGFPIPNMYPNTQS